MGLRTIAVVNPKGGCGKTITAACIAAAVAALGTECWSIDFDPQGHLTAWAGQEDRSGSRPTVAAVLQGDATLEAVAVRWDGDDTPSKTPAGGDRWLVPAGLELEGVAMDVATGPNGVLALRRAITAATLATGWAIVDCPPGLGPATIMALAAAETIVVPVACQPLALRSLVPLFQTVASVLRRLNPTLTVVGIVPTMAEARSPMTAEVLAALDAWVDRAEFGAMLFPAVPRSAKFDEAIARGLPVESLLGDRRQRRLVASYEAIAKRLVTMTDGSGECGNGSI